MSIIIFLIVLVVLIVAHEFGHFIVAKKSGIRVDEFGIGFPPKLFGVKKGETEYTVNAMPFGGFVKIFGEDPDEESLYGPDSARSFVNKPKYIQAGVIVAGVFFNILLAWILFSAGFMSGLPMPVGSAPEGASLSNPVLVVAGVDGGTPAALSGLVVGDRVVALEEGVAQLKDISISNVQSFIAPREGKSIAVSVKHGDEMLQKLVVPAAGIVPDRAAIGITMDMVGTVKLSLLSAIFEGGKLTLVLTWETIKAFGNLIADVFAGTADFSGIAGPVGIVGLVGDASEFGFVYLLGFIAIISINLAVLNLIPFPALDGGRLLFLIIETIKGSPMNPKITNIVHTVGFVVLIGLLLAVTWNDVARLVG